MVSTRTKTETVTVERDGFTLVLPSVMDQIKPIYVIALPGKHTGLVYEETLTERGKARLGNHYSAAIENRPAETKGWRYMVRKADGGPANENAGVGHWAGQFYDNLLDLKLAIEYDAVRLTPKTRTRRERDEED